MSARIKQHTPLHILSEEARKDRPRRGRLGKHPLPVLPQPSPPNPVRLSGAGLTDSLVAAASAIATAVTVVDGDLTAKPTPQSINITDHGKPRKDLPPQSLTNARHTPLPDPQPFDQTLPASIADQTTTITYQRPRRSTANYSMNYDTGKQQRHRARPSVTATLDVTANDEDDDGNRTEGGDSKQ
eukprot:scpid96114/ scgid30209/ 